MLSDSITFIVDRLRHAFVYTTEDRDPYTTFTIPKVEGSFAVLGSPTKFWFQLGLTLFMQSLLCMIFGTIIYVTIVKQRDSPMASIIGFGAIIPTVIALPFYLIRIFNILNMCTMIAFASIPIVLVLRCLEAMYGTTPEFIERDLPTYLGYYGSVVPLQYDIVSKRPRKLSKGEIMSMVARLIGVVVITVVVYSVMIPFAYAPFPSPPPSSFLNYFHWSHLLNNLCVAGVTSLSLDGGTLGVSIGVALLSGCATIQVMDNPMLCSTSPSEFWSLRWNKMVHQLLKRGVYLPCRKQHVPKYMAACMTFFASGMMHEYVLAVIALKGTLHEDQNYTPRHGAHFLFFAWNGMVMFAEYVFADSVFMKGAKGLPRPIRTFLTLMTVIPISHLFTDEYITSGFFSDYSVGFPIIVHLPK